MRERQRCAWSLAGHVESNTFSMFFSALSVVVKVLQLNCAKTPVLNMDDEEYTVELSEDEFFDLTEKLLDEDENNCSPYFRY